MPTLAVDDLPVFDAIDRPDFGLDVDALAEEVYARPYQGLMRTTESGYTEGSLFVYRNADLKALVAHPALSNQPIDAYACPYIPYSDVQPSGFAQLMVNNVFTMQPPVHGPSKQLLARRLTARSLARFEDPIRRLIDDLVDAAATREQIDFRHEVADPVMVGFWQVALGWSPQEAQEICALAGTSQLSNLANPTPEQRRMVNDASLELLRRVEDAVARGLERGDHELLSELAADYDAMAPDAPGRPAVLARMFGASLLDGLHSLGAILASVVHTLLGAPDALAAVRADPGLVHAAFLEGVRLHPAVSFTQRCALEDLTIEGLPIPAGTAVSMAWLLGNRDPAVFDEPNRYRLDRPQRAQTTFGGGFYICPGRNLVGFLSELVLAAVTAPSCEITPAGPAAWAPGTGLHELQTMPVCIRRT